MSSKVFRSVIVGCGGISGQHSAVLSGMENVKVVGCCDIKPDRAEGSARKHGAKAYTDYIEMFEREKPDVVHITTPHPLHTPIACEAAKRGINVLTEKPPAAFREQWSDFEALKGSGVQVGVCFQNRFNGSVGQMKQLLEDGEMGRVLGARADVYWYRPEEYYTHSDWRGSWTTEGGGVLINQSIHTLDLLVWLLGKPVLVGCSMANRHLRHVMEVEDTCEALIRFGDASALFYATTAHCTDAPVRVEIVCEKGTLSMTGDTLTVTRDGKSELFDHTLAPLPGKAYWGTGHTACLRAYYDALETGEAFMNGIDSVKDTMQLMYDMYEPYRGIPMGKVVRE